MTAAILSMVGAGGTVAFCVLWALEYRRAGRVALKLERETAARVASDDQLKRLAVQLATQKRELHEMDEMLDACDDPAAVRARIRRLLQT